MTFVTYSFFIIGLLASGIPVLLHLLMRGKPKRIVFPPLILIQARLNVTKRNFQLKQILLLLLRILIFVIVGLLLSRPTLKLGDWFFANHSANGNHSFVSSVTNSLATQESPIAAALVVDTSPRMNYVLANISRLDAARSYAQWVLGQLPKSSRVAVVDAKREPAAFQIDPLAASQRLQRLNIENNGRTVAESVLDAIRLLDESKMEQQELYVFCDLTQPSWQPEHVKSINNAVEAFKSNNAGGTVTRNVYMVDVGVESPNNCGVTNIHLSDQVASVDMPITLTAEVIQIGDAQSRTAELWLENAGANNTVNNAGDNDNKSERRGSRQIRFAASNNITGQMLTFQLPSLPVGVHHGTIRIDDSDPFGADNTAYFTVDIRSAWQVLIVAPKPVDEHDEYVREILNPSQTPLNPAQTKIGSLFKTETVPPESLERMTLADLQQYSAVMILDPSPLPPTTWKALSDFVGGGGGAAFFLGRRATPPAEFNLPIARDLLGGFPVRQARSGGELWIVPDDYIPSIFSSFRPLSVAETPWQELPVSRYWEMDNLVERVEQAARFSDGRPAILTRRFGRGIAVTMTTPVSDPPYSPANVSPDERHWNYLTDPSWVFMALIDGIARTLVGIGEQKLNFEIGQPAVLTISNATVPANCLLSRPDGTSVRISPNAAERQVRVTTNDNPGQNYIRGTGTKERLNIGFSTNFTPSISDFRRIGTETLDEAFGKNNYRVARTPKEIEVGIARSRVGAELYPVLFMMLCLFFVGEYVFANYFYGRGKSANTV
ncbi:MAG: BatA domain-containing protein [Planctomycetaceae bacterium]|jgi:hypothetical protein|nr:BatA domain-containing protein [Planctomycetaceae bacterium]